MLVLSRRTGEKIVITLPDGREVVVMVVGKRYSNVRLGVEAPDDIEVRRVDGRTDEKQ